jgi:hypothetical protein
MGKDTEKEKCFQEAVGKLNEAREARGQDKMDVKFKQGWVRDANGTWSEQGWSGRLLGSIKKTLGLQNGTRTPDPNAPPRTANPVQYREPDITLNTDVTLTRPDGTKVILDTKFDGDSPGTKPGMGGTTQAEDYPDINKKLGNGVENPWLDKESCKCSEQKKETEEIEVEVPAGQEMFSLQGAPGRLPPGARVPGVPGLSGGVRPGVPIRVPGLALP